MSYLALQNGLPNFSQAVISLWFRVPRASVVAVADHSIGNEAFPMMYHILPLVTFGRQQKLRTYTYPMHNVGTVVQYVEGEPDPRTTYDTPYPVEGASFDVDPSFIGLVCLADGRFNVIINLQTDSYMAFNNSAFITSSMLIYSGSDPNAPVAQADVQGSGVVGLGINVGVATITAVDYTNNDQPEFFTVQSDKMCEPDEWHHLLLSFDIGGRVSIGTPFASSECRLWYAIDDVDYRGAEHMQPYRDVAGRWGRDDLDHNAIITRNAWRFSGQDPNWEAPQYYQNHFIGLPSGSFGGATIPSDSAAMGLPSSAHYVDAVFKCEMAELQMFTGLILDTADEGRRRAFLDYERDAEGHIITDENGMSSLIPVAPDETERLLSRRPEVLLHKVSNWKKGMNTGSLGLRRGSGDMPDEIIEAGQFDPTGTINKYTPDPSLQKAAT